MTTETSIHAHLHHKKKKLHHITGDVMAHEGLFSNSMTEFHITKLIRAEEWEGGGGNTGSPALLPLPSAIGFVMEPLTQEVAGGQSELSKW